jgi:predicted small lipoprotein YifL
MTKSELRRWIVPTALVGAGVMTLALTACGEVGPLQQPPPLFGQDAKNDYYAQRAARARAAEDQNDASRNTTGSAEREVNTVDDDQPLSTRDIQDPASKMTTPRDSPVPGEPNPLGPNVSTTPPN